MTNRFAIGGASVARRLYDFSVKHWIWASILCTLPGWCGIIFKLFGDTLHLTASSGAPTRIGTLFFVGMFACSVVFAFLKSWANVKDEDGKRAGSLLQQKLLDSVNDVTQAKQRRFEEYIVNSQGLHVDGFHRELQPVDQIQRILESMRIAVAEISDINRDMICSSVVYRDPDGRWDWLAKVNAELEHEPGTLVHNDKSALYQVIKRGRSIVFHPDKREALVRNEYVESARDQMFGNIGSIYVADLTLRKNSTEYFAAVVSLSTYGCLLCTERDDASKNKIQQLVMPPFLTRLKLELSLHYIQTALRVAAREVKESGRAPKTAGDAGR